MRKVQIQVPDEKQFNEWVGKTAKLFQGEKHTFKRHGVSEYTVTEVILKALESLAAEQDEREKEEGIKKNKKV